MTKNGPTEPHVIALKIENALHIISITVDKYSADEQQKALGGGGSGDRERASPRTPLHNLKKKIVGLKTPR